MRFFNNCKLSTIVVAFTFATLISRAQQHLTLFYDKPAAHWNEALPIGNGRLGAMVFGNPAQERLQLNEETVWAGEPGNNIPTDVYDQIQAIRKLLFEGKNKEAQELSNKVFPRYAAANNNYGMPYQPVGDVNLEFPGHEKFTNYRRELNIQDAVFTSTYTVNEVTYKREVIASLIDDVIIMRISANKAAGITLTITMKSPHSNRKVFTTGKHLYLTGTTGNSDNKTGKVRFETQVKPVIKGGTLVASDSTLTINAADEVLLYISTATNFKNYKDLSENASTKATTILDKAIAKPYRAALAAHIAKYHSFFNRVVLNLGTTPQEKKTTDIRVKEFSSQPDPSLVSLYFQFGRYLLISSSQPGSNGVTGQPANLQGIWNDKMAPPWDSKYTININTEMNYWPAEVTNLSEMHQPLFAMIKDLSETGRESASKMYHARGWNVHHNTDLWRISGVVDGGFYGMWPMGGAWLTQHIWKHFQYSGDKRFLEEYYPVLKGAAMFYLDVLQEHPQSKWLVVAPSISPENTYASGVGVSAGTTMDNQLVFDVLNNLVRSATILKKDKPFADSVKAALNRLPPMQVGQHSQLQEWLTDLDRVNDKHRHISHLYGLYPSGQISPFRNPELYEASKNSLIYRGDKSTGWSMGWKVNWWARLLDGEKAYKLISDQLSPAPLDGKGESGGTYPNLLDAHPPFQIDGNFGCTAGIAEMLLQSYDGEIFILPALPSNWKEGSVKGLRAIGGFEIDISWKNSNIETLIVKSNLGGNCRLRFAKGIKLSGNVRLTDSQGENPNDFYTVNQTKKVLVSDKAQLKGIQLPPTEIKDFNTQAGKIYRFVATK